MLVVRSADRKMITKVVVAAAGKGTRMLQVAKNKPKHLINVQKRPFLYYLLKNIKEAGIEEIILVIGHKKEAMEEFSKEYEKEFNLTLVNQFQEVGESLYGTAIPIQCVEKYISENFIALYGDNLYSPKDIKRMAVDDNYTYLGAINHSDPKKYGVIVTQGDTLKNIIEKPKEPPSQLINTGLYKFTPAIFQKVKNLKPSPRGEYELTDAIQALAQKQLVKIKILEDYWLDFGNPGDILKMWKFLNSR